MSMFNLYLLNPDEPWKKKLIESEASYDDLEKKYGFSAAEIDEGIENEIIRGVFYLELTPYFMQCILDDGEVEEDTTDAGVKIFEIWSAGNPASNETKHDVMSAIAGKMGLSCGRTKNILCEAMGKLKSTGRIDDLLTNLIDYYEMRSRVGMGEV